MTSAPKRRILVIGTNYAPELTGIGPYTALLAESLHTGGFDVSVVTGVPHYPEWRVHADYRRRVVVRESVNEVRVMRLRHPVPQHPDLKGRAMMDGAFLAAAVGPVTTSPADAIIAVTPSLAGLAAARIGSRGRPIGAIVQDLTGAAASQTGSAGSTSAGAIARVELALLKKAALVGVVAESFATPLIDGGVKASNIVNLPNPTRITASALTSAEAQTAMGWRNGRPQVVHTGNMGLKQGLQNVIDTAALLPSIDFRLVGDGNQRGALQVYAETRGITNVQFVPPVPEAEYSTVLAAADLLLLSEAASVEAMSLPSKITSYVAANRPILAAVNPEGITAAHLLKHRIAHVVQPEAQQIADGILAALSDQTLRAACLQGQVEMIKLLSVEQAAERYQAFAQSLLDRK